MDHAENETIIMEQIRIVKIQVIIGSTRQGRYSEKPAEWILNELEQLEGVEAELVDLRDYPLPFYDEAVSPMKLNGRYSKSDVTRWSEKVKQADAFIIVSPEYNHGYTAVLKNAIDHLYPEWNHKPVGFVSYGSVGGARVIEQIRLVAIELQMFPIKNAIHIPLEVYMATMGLEGAPAREIFNKLLRQGARDFAGIFLNELVSLTQCTRELRKPFHLPNSFST
jgi:NAD(P)H-dependent FMN reductase